MALIKCPECKKKISDQCANCPQCGYPINSAKQGDDIENSESNGSTKKPFYKNVWIWSVVGIVLVALVLGGIMLFNGDTEPMLDEDGKPVFVELTNEVYTNAEEYLAYHVNIKGEVFQVMSDDGSVKGIQVWLDPDTCEQNIMIYYNTDVEVKQGDYIICSGYIDSVTEYSNAFGANLYAPVVISKDLKKSTYIEVMSPTIESIIPENLKQEKYGYAFSVDKIEFAEKETRIYATATNNGKSLLYVGDAVIVQNGKQYNSTSNYDAEYEEIPYEIVKGVSSSGIIVFPTIINNDFDLTISIHSDDYDEEIEDFVFKIYKNPIKEEKIEESKPSTIPSTQSNTASTTATNKIPSTASAVGLYTHFSTGEECTFSLHIYEDGTFMWSNDDVSGLTSSGTWTQSGSSVTFEEYSIIGDETFYYKDTYTLNVDGIQYGDWYYTRN